MNAHECCGAEELPLPVRHRAVRLAGWVVPGAVLVAMPKCPACVAAYVALGTGVGLSFSTASHLRMTVMVLCIALLSYLAARAVHGWVARLLTKKGVAR